VDDQSSYRQGACGGRKVRPCGQEPSNDSSFVRLLVKEGIDSISVAPDSFFAVKQHLARAEAGLHDRRCANQPVAKSHVLRPSDRPP
jgi:phosphoenolpyruvate-protein kinase (PTS system EI component)